MSESVIALSRFRADLSRALGRRGRKLLELSPDELASEVQSLEPLESYLIVKELGPADAAPIVWALTGEQIQTAIDLDVWHHDELRLADLDSWLALFAHQGPLELAKAFLTLDPELQTLTLASLVRVFDPSTDNIPEPGPDTRRSNSPDGFFMVDEVSTRGRDIGGFQLIDALYKHDIQEGYKQLLAVRQELPSNLLEESFAFRSGRLEDLGFPPRERAMRIFAAPGPVPEAPATSFAPISLPAAYAAALTEDSLLQQAMAGIQEPEVLEILEVELVALVNAAVIAYDGRVGDLETSEAIAERVRNIVSLGLEALLEGSRPIAGFELPTEEEKGAKAAAAIRRLGLRYVFQLGHREIVPLQRRAAALLEDPVVKHWLDRHEDERDDYSQERLDRLFLRALAKTPPLWAAKSQETDLKLTTWASLGEVGQCAERLEAIAARIR